MIRIGVVGAGKVGISLAHSLKAKGFSITAISDSQGTRAFDRARFFLGEDSIYTDDNRVVVRNADVVAVATQDRIIKNVAREIADSDEDIAGKLFFHTSGAEPSSIMSSLRDRGAIIGSLHPLQTFPDIESAIEALPETCIFIEGMAEAIPFLKRIGDAMGSRVFEIQAEDKRAYHLSAVLVCNLLCALFYTATDVMEEIGIGLEPFLPIIRTTMKNIEQKGPLVSLTGPIARGDDQTVLSHLEVMAHMGIHRSVYTALSMVALEMAMARNLLTEEEHTRMRAVLEQK